MDKLNLSLRQRKLLHMMQEQTTYITGNELAKQLGVSPRTIRSDIVEINQNILPYHAKILSARSKGYLYTAENPEIIQQLNQIDTAFFTKEDRIRYLAFRLCLTDEHLNLFDLEDEMFISHTTLEHDLHSLKMKYVLSEPYIKLEQKRNFLTFEENEQKRRSVLNRLFHEDWNYNHNWNTYYGYTFLNKDVLDYIMDEVPLHLDKYGISMEDPSLVSLNLAAAIMYHRVLSGHQLPPASPVLRPDTPASLASDSLADALEGQFHCSFSREERDDLYQRIASGHLPDVSDITPLNISQHFGPVTIQLAKAYIDRIQDVFHLDFSEDEDFYITLLSYIQSASLIDQVKVENRERMDYREFLRKFSVLKEEMTVDPDSFDYNFYSYGLSLYGNMPLIEPQEWKEVQKVEEFVIVIDTSMSCSGELVKKFLEETYGVLSENDSFFRKVNIHIIQCDDQIQTDQKITCEEELKSYMEKLELKGEGGTDFRPAFAYVDEMIRQHTFEHLRGMIYFTDGRGIYPAKRPVYETAFVFMEEEYEDVDVPPWAIKIILEEGQDF